MRNHLRLVFLVAIYTLLFSGCSKAKESSSADLYLAPNFELQDLQQDYIRLSSYRDKQPVILFFWTTWCPYCRDELKLLNNMYPELKKDGWELLAIAVEDPEFKVKRFVKNYNLNFKILLDRFADAADSYDLLGIPTYFFVNKKGEIIFKGHNFPKAKYKSLLK